MSVFIAGKRYVGVVGDRARKSDVYRITRIYEYTSSRERGTYDEVITEPCSYLCNGVGRAWSYENNVCPSPQLNVENRVSDFVSLFSTGQYSLRQARSTLYLIPFILVRPNPTSKLGDVVLLEECQG
jgi:hypothetical protein